MHRPAVSACIFVTILWPMTGCASDATPALGCNVPAPSFVTSAEDGQLQPVTGLSLTLGYASADASMSAIGLCSSGKGMPTVAPLLQASGKQLNPVGGSENVAGSRNFIYFIYAPLSAVDLTVVDGEALLGSIHFARIPPAPKACSRPTTPAFRMVTCGSIA